MAGSPSIITAIQIKSPTPTIEVHWNAPLNGAEVTAFAVHYKLIGGDSFILDTEENVSSAVLDELQPLGSYEITIEAKSIHLSGFSPPVTIELC